MTPDWIETRVPPIESRVLAATPYHLMGSPTRLLPETAATRASASWADVKHTQQGLSVLLEGHVPACVPCCSGKCGGTWLTLLHCAREVRSATETTPEIACMNGLY